jgi:hypothetical protein
MESPLSFTDTDESLMRSWRFHKGQHSIRRDIVPLNLGVFRRAIESLNVLSGEGSAVEHEWTGLCTLQCSKKQKRQVRPLRDMKHLKFWVKRVPNVNFDSEWVQRRPEGIRCPVVGNAA